MAKKTLAKWAKHHCIYIQSFYKIPKTPPQPPPLNILGLRALGLQCLHSSPVAGLTTQVSSHISLTFQPIAAVWHAFDIAYHLARHQTEWSTHTHTHTHTHTLDALLRRSAPYVLVFNDMTFLDTYTYTDLSKTEMVFANKEWLLKMCTTFQWHEDSLCMV